MKSHKMHCACHEICKIEIGFSKLCTTIFEIQMEYVNKFRLLINDTNTGYLMHTQYTVTYFNLVRLFILE